jgi:transcriptional regulator with XRE-family HTH domain
MDVDDATLARTLASLLRRERLRLGMTLEELARVTGLNSTQLSRLELAQIGKPALSDTLKLLSFFHIDPKVLLGEAQEEPSLYRDALSHLDAIREVADEEEMSYVNHLLAMYRNYLFTVKKV